MKLFSLFFIFTLLIAANSAQSAFELNDDVPANEQPQVQPKPKQGLVLDGQTMRTTPSSQKKQQAATIAAGTADDDREKGNVLKEIERATAQSPKRNRQPEKVQNKESGAEQNKKAPTYDPNNPLRLTASEAEAFAASNPDFLDMNAEMLQKQTASEIKAEMEMFKGLKNGNELIMFNASEPRANIQNKKAKDDKLKELSDNRLVVFGLIGFFAFLIVSVIMLFVNLIRANNAVLAIKRLKKKQAKKTKIQK